MMNNSLRREYYFYRKPDKFGRKFSAFKCRSGIHIKPETYFGRVLSFHEKAAFVDNITSLRYLIQNIGKDYFAVLLKKPSELTLEDFIAFRSDLKMNYEKTTIPKSHVKNLFTLCAKAHIVLSDESEITDLPKWQGVSTSSKPRSVQVASLFDLIKSENSTENARITAQTEIDKIFNDYQNAAIDIIKSYEHLINFSQQYVDRGISGRHAQLVMRQEKTRIYSGMGEVRFCYGMNCFYLNPSLREILPAEVLRACLIILKLKYPHNTDVWLTMTLNNISIRRTSIEFHEAVKGKTNKFLQSFVILNTDRLVWRAINMVLNHHKKVNDFCKENNIERKRSPVLFDYIVNLKNRDFKHLGGGLEYSINNDFLNFTGLQYKKNFVEKYGLPYLSFDALRNLSATKLFLCGSTVKEIQQLLGHSSESTTEHYIEQNITNDFLRHNMLSFCREYERDIIKIGSNNELKIADDGSYSFENSRYFHLSDGVSCINPKNSPVEDVEKGVCSGALCHSRECTNRRIILDKRSVWYALLKREYFRENLPEIISNKKKFEAIDIHDIVFNASFCFFIKQQQPSLYKQLTDILYKSMEL